MLEADDFRRSLRFVDESDLSYEVMDFFYNRMLSRIIRDARERSVQFGWREGYAWGKRYLDHYVGYLCLVSKAEHPALHSSVAYDLVTDRLIYECTAADERE